MRAVAVVCAIAAFALIAPSVQADLFNSADLDQYQNSWSHGSGEVGLFSVADSVMMAQTFTAGKSGTLYGIEIGMPAWGFGDVSELAVEIYEGQPGPDWTSLTSFTLPAPPSGLVWYDVFDNYHVNSPILDVPVARGTMYSIVLSANGQSGTAYVAATDHDSYLDPAGALWLYNLDADRWFQSSDPSIDYGVYDMQFRTYVRTQPVPLPAGVWLGILGLSVAGWRLKRQTA